MLVSAAIARGALPKVGQPDLMRALVIGAGVTGCFTAARLMEKGVDVTLLARGAKADRLERDGLRLRDGITDDERRVELPIVRSPVTETFDFAMVCVQAIHREPLGPLLEELPGRPVVWFLGNTTTSFEGMGRILGRDRVLGGFPGVGGTWDDDVLLYADREGPNDAPFDKLVIGEAFPEGAAAAQAIHDHLVRAGMNMEHYVPIMAWHWSHVAFILPLAGAVFRHDGDLEAVAADRALQEQTMRAVAQAFTVVKRAGHPILPRRLRLMRWIPAKLGARKIGPLLSSRFGKIALAGHAATARDEMRGFGSDLLALAKGNAGAELRSLIEAI